MASMNDFIGRWKLVKSDNFDEYMKEIGVQIVLRKAAAFLKPTLEVYLDDDGVTWHFNHYSTFRDTKLVFRLNEEFIEVSPDDRKYKSFIIFENGKIHHRQTAITDSQKDSTFTTWIEHGILMMNYQSGDVICHREFQRE